QGELERVATLKGIRAVYLGTNVNGRELSAPEFAPVFARLEALGLPVLLHPISVVGAERLRPFYLHNLLGNPFDTAIAAAHLVFGGVLDRHPKLQVCLPHAGGALPYLVGRLGHGQRVRPEARERARRPFERSEEHTSELQSLAYLVCRLLLEKKKKKKQKKQKKKIK